MSPTATCVHCGEPAACVGRYESDENYSYACDACCGHGCEDGHCIQVDKIPALLDWLRAEAKVEER